MEKKYIVNIFSNLFSTCFWIVLDDKIKKKYYEVVAEVSSSLD
jgi:hypothetical protein